MTPAVPAPLLAIDAPSLLYRAFFRSRTRSRTPMATGQRPLRHGELRPLGRRASRAARGLPVLRRGGRALPDRSLPSYNADRPPMPEGPASQWADVPALDEDFG